MCKTSRYSGKPSQCLLVILLQVIEFCHCKFDVVKTEQTKRKSGAEKERREKYRIAKVPPKFGTVAKVVTHDPPVLPGQPDSTRNLPYCEGKYFIQSILNTVYVKGVKIKYMYLLFAYSCQRGRKYLYEM